MQIKEYLKEKAKEVDLFLDKFLPPETAYPEVIHKSLRYSIFAGGKRIRPILCIAAYETVTEQPYQKIAPLFCALELVHTYSLIHDDLPCIDNDDYRRGKLTNHKVFGENIAVLAGDSLLTLAFEFLSRAAIERNILLKIIEEFSYSIGTKGLIGGQVVDIISEGEKISKKTLKYIHLHKTASLIESSLKIGALAAGAKPKELSALGKYGQNIGLAFQVADDILDVVGNAKNMGKTLGKDEAVEKATYVKVYGLQKAKLILNDLVSEAVSALNVFREKQKPLVEIANFIAYRDN